MSATKTELRNAILLMVREVDEGKSVSPADIAMHLAGKDEKLWSKLMKPIRDVAVELANEGELVILRKKKPVDPNDFKGIYRLVRKG